MLTYIVDIKFGWDGRVGLNQNEETILLSIKLFILFKL